MSQANTGPMTEQARDATSDVASDAADKAVAVKETAKAEVRSVVSDATDQAATVLQTTSSELRTKASEQTQQLSSTLTDLSDQLATMADTSDEPHAQVASLARSAADELSRRAGRLDDGGFDGLIADTKRFARQRPGAFLLGSIAAGFAVGRLAKHADLKGAVDAAKTDTSKPDPARSEAGSGSDAMSSAIPPASPPPAGMAENPLAATPPAGELR